MHFSSSRCSARIARTAQLPGLPAVSVRLPASPEDAGKIALSVVDTGLKSVRTSTQAATTGR